MQNHHSVNAIKQTWKWLTMILLAFNGVGALFGGYHLMHDPSGRSIQLPSEFLNGSIFPDYFIPGLALFVLIGILSIISFGFGLFRAALFSNLVTIQGILLAGWLLIQILTIREFYFLQVIFGSIALFFIFAGRTLKPYKTEHSRYAPPSR